MKISINTMSPDCLYTLFQIIESDISSSLEYDDQYLKQAIIARNEFIEHVQSLKANFPLVYQGLDFSSEE